MRTYKGKRATARLITTMAGLATMAISLVGAASEQLVDTVWDYDHGFGCVTTITFLDTEKYLLESSGQVVMKEYELTQHRDTEFFLLAQETVANNNQPSCAGIKAGRVGSRQRAYVQFGTEDGTLTFFPKPDNESPVRVTYLRRNFAPVEPQE